MRPLFLLFAFIASLSAVAQNEFIKVHEGKHWIWYATKQHWEAHSSDIEKLFGYADTAFEHLTNAWGVKTKQEKYSLLVNPQRGGGFAAGDIGEVRSVTGKHSPGIGVSYDAFTGSAYEIRAYWAYVLITHEMVNLFTGDIVSGGWPVDWWADHRSPFPYITAVQIELALRPEIGIKHLAATDDPLVRMFADLKDQYGWNMFRTAFKFAIDDGINWSRVGPNPSPVLTNYVVAYLQLGAGKPLDEYMATLVPAYDRKMIDDILRARAKWKETKTSKERERLRELYLGGKFAEVLSAK
jgi:hypothetical protein